LAISETRAGRPWAIAAACRAAGSEIFSIDDMTLLYEAQSQVKTEMERM
jgi:hypothetical protein